MAARPDWKVHVIMLFKADIEYLRRRLREEEQRAAATTCPCASAAHRKLAQLYRDRIGEMRSERLLEADAAEPEDKDDRTTGVPMMQ